MSPYGVSRPQWVHILRPYTDKIVANLQTFSNLFSCMKIVWCILIQTSQLTKAIIGSDYGLLAGRHQALIWTNGGPVFWHIYASLNNQPRWLGCFVLAGFHYRYWHCTGMWKIAKQSMVVIIHVLDEKSNMSCIVRHETVFVYRQDK